MALRVATLSTYRKGVSYDNVRCSRMDNKPIYVRRYLFSMGYGYVDSCLIIFYADKMFKEI